MTDPETKYLAPGDVLSVAEVKQRIAGGEHIWIELVGGTHGIPDMHHPYLAGLWKVQTIIGYRDYVSAGPIWCRLSTDPEAYAADDAGAEFDGGWRLRLRDCVRVTKDKLLKCDNCSRLWVEEALAHVFPDIPDLGERLSPGGVVPSGDCPSCGAFVYPLNMKETPGNEYTG